MFTLPWYIIEKKRWDTTGVIHKSQATHKALEALPRVRLHFLPPYSPGHNPIERLWKQMHGEPHVAGKLEKSEH